MSKTEKELLELAAKAAGIEGEWCAFFGITGHGAGKKQFGIGDPAVFVWGIDRLWNPLEDDGDALRLAVKLHLQLSCGSHLRRSWATRGAIDWYAYWDQFDGDEGKAIRYAIVRAAAEIGKAMP